MDITQFTAEIERVKKLSDHSLATETETTHEQVSALLAIDPAYQLDWSMIQLLESECAARFCRGLLKKD